MQTYVNGRLVYDNGRFDDTVRGLLTARAMTNMPRAALPVHGAARGISSSPTPAGTHLTAAYKENGTPVRRCHK